MRRISWLLVLVVLASACNDSPDALYHKASALFDQKDYIGAVALLDSVLAKDDSFDEAYFMRGSSNFNLGNFEAAVADYDKVISMEHKNDPEAYFYRGDCFYNLDQYDKAIKDFTMAVTLKPAYARAFHFRANTWLASGNIDSALVDYQRSINIDPNQAGPYYGLANYYSNVPDYEQAIALYSKAIELEPQADYYFNRGLVHYLENDFDNAIADFTNTVSLDKTYMQAYVMRGNSKDELGFGADALVDFDEAIRLDPTYGSAYFNRGITRKSQGDTKGACEDFHKALELGYQEAITKTGDCPN